MLLRADEMPEIAIGAHDNEGIFFDAALIYDPHSRSCDLALGADGDLLIDATPITPMLLSVELDARAAADDRLPQAASSYLKAAGIDVRRGRGAETPTASEPAAVRLYKRDRGRSANRRRLC